MEEHVKEEMNEVHDDISQPLHIKENVQCDNKVAKGIIDHKCTYAYTRNTMKFKSFNLKILSLKQLLCYAMYDKLH